MIYKRKWHSIRHAMVVVLSVCFIVACESNESKINRYTEEITKNPKNYEAYHYRAKSKMKMDDYSSALEDFQQAAALVRNSSREWEIYYDMSESLYYLKRRRDALEALKTAIVVLGNRDTGAMVSDDMAMLKLIKERAKKYRR